jgi:hypothetical protein
MNFHIDEGEEENVRFTTVTNIDLSSKHEALKLDLSAGGILPVMTFKPESLEIGITFRKVKLELPEISKKSPPPQFLPDKRFQEHAYRPPEKKKEGTDIDLHLQALGKKTVAFVTDLLDEPLRLNFDLQIKEGNIEEGFVSALPLKTKVFKRPVHLKSMKITFQAPLEPVIKAKIIFPLPEYKVTLNLEGPLSRPRYAFKSEPPLPENDIYAVLLFGRPLADLGTEDSASAQKTNEILANGILSLSVLYFLAGSPVEYVGFDPESNTASAQFGLSDKTSLRVGGGEGGMNSGAIRHSLGKGWYIDTSVQNSNKLATEANKNNYGVLLERVIAY